MTTTTLSVIVTLFAAILVFLFFRKRSKTETLPFSDLSLYQKYDKSFLLRLDAFFVGSLLFFLLLSLLHLSYPYTTTQEQQKTSSRPHYKEGISITFLLDNSSSMQRNVTTSWYGTLPLFSLLKEVTNAFIVGEEGTELKGRPNDLLSIVTFARKVNVITPPTFNLQHLSSSLEKLHVVKTRDEDATLMGYALYKTAHLLSLAKKAAKSKDYTLRKTVIIMITDGLQTTHPEDLGKKYRSISLDDAAHFAKEKGITLYIVTLDKLLQEPDYAPERRQLARATQETGGALFLLQDPGGLLQVIETINLLEKDPYFFFGQEAGFAQKKEDYPLWPLFSWLSLTLALALALFRFCLYPRFPT